MKRTSVVLLASGALVAAITGTALAGGSDDTSPAARSASSTTASASASSAPTSTSTSTPGIPTESPSESQSESPSNSATTDPSADDTAAPTSTTTAPSGAGTAVGSMRAGQIARSHVGGGTITEVEAETEHGRAVWSVKIVKNGSRYEVHVDRSSGEVTRSRAKADDDRRDDGEAVATTAPGTTTGAGTTTTTARATTTIAAVTTRTATATGVTTTEGARGRAGHGAALRPARRSSAGAAARRALRPGGSRLRHSSDAFVGRIRRTKGQARTSAP